MDKECRVRWNPESDIMKRNVLITGGSGTIGQALVRRFGKKYSVIFQYNQNEKVARQLELETGARKWKVDLQGEDIEVPGDISILINNAGINEGYAVTEAVGEETWRTTLEINLTASWRLTKLCLPYMLESGWGRVITISSVYGYRGAVGFTPYTVSKHGLRGLTVSLALEYGERGITANEVCPGPVESNMVRRIAEECVGSDGVEGYLEEVREELPIGRLITADDVAWASEFLASEESSGINGISLPVDGGMTA